MENRAFKVQWLPLLADALFTSAEYAKVLSGLRRHIGVQLKDDAVSLASTNGYVKPPEAKQKCLDGAGLNEKYVK